MVMNPKIVNDMHYINQTISKPIIYHVNKI